MRSRVQPARPIAPIAVVALTLGLLATAASAHVALLDPNGGEDLQIGDSVSVEWMVLIEHNTQNWDLWYSTTGPDGPWLPIATDLPPGDTAADSVHTFVWSVPADPSTQVRVRVRQDNVGTDWLDVSDADLTIRDTAALFADGFESGDTDAWSDTVISP